MMILFRSGGVRGARRAACAFMLGLLLPVLTVSAASGARKGYTYETDPIRLGTKALEEGNYAEAQKYFDEAVASDYQIYKAHFGQAEIHRLQGMYAESEPLYRQSQIELNQAKQFDFAERPAGLGLALLKMGRYSEAAEQFEEALKIKGGLWQAHFGMAMISAQAGELDKALSSLEKGAKRKGLLEGEDLYEYGMGLVLFKREDLTQAIQHALRAFSMNMNDSDYGTLVAEIYTKQGAASLAIQAFEQALVQPGARPTADMLHRLGNLYFGEKQYNDAIRQYAESAKLDSTYAPAWKDMGKLYFLASRYDESASAYLRYAQLRPEDPEGMIGLAQSCQKTKRYGQALEAAQKAFSIDSTNVVARLELARASFQNRDRPRAAVLYASITDTLQLKSEDYSRIGQLRLDENDLEGAGRQFDIALTMDSTCADCFYYKGFIFLKQDSTEKAITEFQKAIDLDPENPGYHLNKGIAQMRIKDRAGAIATLRRGTELAPTSAQIRLYFAQSLVTDSTSAAIREYQKARELEPDNVKVLLGLGLAYMTQKNYSLAIGVLREATQKEPGNADAWAYYAQALALQNDVEGAIRAAEKALELNPEQATAKKLLEILKKQPAPAGGKK